MCRGATSHAHLGWHVISADRLMELLRRANKGEDPDALYIEEWANAKHHFEEGQDDRDYWPI